MISVAVYYCVCIAYSVNFSEENLGEFGESLVVHQILTMSQHINKDVKKANKQEFAKILLTKSF